MLMCSFVKLDLIKFLMFIFSSALPPVTFYSRWHRGRALEALEGLCVFHHTAEWTPVGKAEPFQSALTCFALALLLFVKKLRRRQMSKK